jgi:hypothetical protein
MILNVKGTETTLSANTNVSNARAVRVFNKHTAAVLITIQDSSETTIGTFSIQSNTVEILEKSSTDELLANNNGDQVLVTNLGFSIS